MEFAQIWIKMKLIIRGQVSGLSGHYYPDTRCLKIGQIVRISDIRYYPATILYLSGLLYLRAELRNCRCKNSPSSLLTKTSSVIKLVCC